MLTTGKGLCVVITGPAGAGKSTVTAKIIDILPGCAQMVTSTSRPPRKGEVDGREYHFLTREAFLAGVERGEFLEYEDNYGKLYGSSRVVLDHMLAVHRVVVAVIDPKGARTYLEKVPEALTLFLAAPREQVAARMARRPGITQEEVDRRLADYDCEMAMAGLFDYVVGNFDGGFDTTATMIAGQIVIEREAASPRRAERMRRC